MLVNVSSEYSFTRPCTQAIASHLVHMRLSNTCTTCWGVTHAAAAAVCTLSVTQHKHINTTGCSVLASTHSLSLRLHIDNSVTVMV